MPNSYIKQNKESTHILNIQNNQSLARKCYNEIPEICQRFQQGHAARAWRLGIAAVMELRPFT